MKPSALDTIAQLRELLANLERAHAAPAPAEPEPKPLIPASKPQREVPVVAYSVQEVIDMAPFSRSTVWDLIRNGALPVRKLGRRSFILREEWEEFLRRCPTGTDRHSVEPLRRLDARKRQAAHEAQPET
jgi:hypothetical protein